MYTWPSTMADDSTMANTNSPPATMGTNAFLSDSFGSYGSFTSSGPSSNPVFDFDASLVGNHVTLGSASPPSAVLDSGFGSFSPSRIKRSSSTESSQSSSIMSLGGNVTLSTAPLMVPSFGAGSAATQGTTAGAPTPKRKRLRLDHLTSEEKVMRR